MKDFVVVEDIIPILNSLDDERMNPKASDTEDCMYSDEHGNHCIAGEIIFRLGFPLPELGTFENSTTVEDMMETMGYESHFHHDVINILQKGQGVADRRTYADDNYAWGMAKQTMIEEINNCGR